MEGSVRDACLFHNPELLQESKSHLIPHRLRKYFNLYTSLSNKQIREEWDADRICVEIRELGAKIRKSNYCDIVQISGDEEEDDEIPEGSDSSRTRKIKRADSIVDGLQCLVFPSDRVFWKEEEVLPRAIYRFYIVLNKPGME